MQKRLLLIVLILLAAGGLFAVYWFVLRPVLPGAPVLQPPASTQQPSVREFQPENAVPQPPTATGPAPSATDPAEQERQAQEAFKRFAMDLAGRVGTYSNADQYGSLRTLQASVDTAYATKLEELRQSLLREHPSYGSSYGQSLRALSATIDAGSLPLSTRTTAKITVQGQLTTDANGVSQTKYVTVTFDARKNGTSWIATDAVFAEMAR
ncbi:hypothetical protein IT407_04090 [Candidatus Uhrbacteria bacterium]|nr:hypothetical protein [Candidatus Uhrbacteria bacterium]